jgi:hypothetical protein
MDEQAAQTHSGVIGAPLGAGSTQAMTQHQANVDARAAAEKRAAERDLPPVVMNDHEALVALTQYVMAGSRSVNAFHRDVAIEAKFSAFLDAQQPAPASPGPPLPASSTAPVVK